MVIEPVHCGSSSILKVRLFWAPCMSKDYACATDSQSKHIHGRDNQNSDRKGSKMAKNGKILAKMAL